MTRHQIPIPRTLPPTGPGAPETDRGAPWTARLRARVFAGRYDRQIENGVSPVPGSPLAEHAARITSARERDDLARTLRLVVRDAEKPPRCRTVRMPVHPAGVRRGADEIEAICDRLGAPFPVHARGMARLRIVLADGRGPLYRSGPGTLTAALRGVLAAL